MARKRYEVFITANGKVAENVLSGLKEQAAKFKDEMDRLKAAGKENTAEFQKAKQTYETFTSSIENAEKGMRLLEKVTNDLAGSSTKELRSALKRTKAILDSLSATDPKREKYINDFNRIKEQIDKNNSSLRTSTSIVEENTINLDKNASSWLGVAKGIGVVAVAAKGLEFIKNKISAIVTSNLELSDSLASVRKVTGLSADEIDILGSKLSKLDTRSTISQLNEIAEAGGRMGIAVESGMEGIYQFTKAANQIQVSLGDDLGEGAIEQIAKLASNLGLFKTMGIEKAMLSIGSSINELGATSTAKGGNIVEFARRVSASAQMVGLSGEDILALGSAIDASGITAEVGASSFSKFFTSIRTNTGAIEKALKIPKGTLDNLYNSGKTMESILLILDRMKGKDLRELDGVMKLLGGSGERMATTFASMAKNVDELRNHVDVSRKAFEEHISITDEFNNAENTALGYLEKANNLYANTFTNPEYVSIIKELSKAWYDFSKAITQNEAILSVIKTTISAVVLVFKSFLSILPAIVGYISTAGLVAGFTMLKKAIVNAATAMGMMDVATNKVIFSWKTLGVALKSNWLGLAIAGIMEVVFWFGKWDEENKKAQTELRNLQNAFAKSKETIESVVKPLEVYKNALNDANLSEKQKMDMVKDFKNDYQEYLDYLGIEINNAYDLADAYAQVVDVMKLKKAYEERESYRNEVNSDNKNDRIANQAEVVRIANSMGVAIDKKWLEANQAKGTTQLYREIFKKKYGDTFTSSSSDSENILIDVLNPGKKTVGPRVQRKWRNVGNTNLYNAINAYIKSFREERDVNKQVDERFNTEYKDIGLDTFNIDEYNKKVQEARWKRGGQLENEKPDKAAIAEARKAELAQKKEWRQQLQESEAEAKAIVDNIKNFYQRQITETLNIATQTGMNEEIQDQLVRDLTMRMNTALANARKGIVGAKNDWEEFKKTLQADMIEPLVDGTNESMELLDRIENNNLAALRKKIELLSRSLNKPESALLDQVWKNATLNEKANAQIENKEEQRRRQAILDRNYTEKVNVDTQTTMEQFGFAMLTPQQIETIRKGGDDAKRFLDERTKEWQAILENARNNFAQLAATNPDNREDLFSILFGQDWQSHQDDTTLKGLLDLTGEDFKLFYDELIKYNDAYVEARKKAAEQVVKVNDYVFENSHYVKQTNEEIRNLEQFSQQQQREGGMPRDMMQRMGMADTMANDPELIILAKKEDETRKFMEKMRKLYEQRKIDIKQYNEAIEGYDNARAAHADKVAQEVRERIEQLHNMVAPVEDFGWAVGEAFATMTRDAEEGRLALQDAARQMVEQFGKMTIKIYAELMTQKVQKALFNREMEAEDERHAIAETRTTEQGENKKVSVVKSIGALLFGTKKKQAKQEEQIERKSQNAQTDVLEEGEKSKLDVVSAIETGMTAIKQTEAQKVSNIATESAAQDATVTAQETTGKVNAGIASGAANIIGKLGWWGIPLVAVITALLNGLLAFALSKLFGGGKKSEEGASVNTKLASEMLTYDKGNVQQAIGNAKRKNDERAEILTAPTVTVVQGEPSIVAEKGPELVVGRRTTQRLMRERPDIVSDIIALDQDKPQPTMQEIDRLPFASLTKDVMSRLLKDNKNGKQINTHLPVPIKMFDAGNVRKVINMGPELVVGRETMQTTMLSRTNILQTITESNRNMATRNFVNPNSQNAQSNNQDAAAMQQQMMTNEELVNTLRVLTPAIMALQQQLQKPIKAEINKYGRGGLIDEVKSGMKFSEKYGL